MSVQTCNTHGVKFDDAEGACPDCERFGGMSNFELVMLAQSCKGSADESDKQFAKDCLKELSRRKP